jgi:hypothetical protein
LIKIILTIISGNNIACTKNIYNLALDLALQAKIIFVVYSCILCNKIFFLSYTSQNIGLALQVHRPNVASRVSD